MMKELGSCQYNVAKHYGSEYKNNMLMQRLWLIGIRHDDTKNSTLFK